MSQFFPVQFFFNISPWLIHQKWKCEYNVYMQGIKHREIKNICCKVLCIEHLLFDPGKLNSKICGLALTQTTFGGSTKADETKTTFVFIESGDSPLAAMCNI